MEIATKFANWEVPELSALQDSKAYQLREHLNKGGKLNRTEKNWLTEAINGNTDVYKRQPLPYTGMR